MVGFFDVLSAGDGCFAHLRQSGKIHALLCLCSLFGNYGEVEGAVGEFERNTKRQRQRLFAGHDETQRQRMAPLLKAAGFEGLPEMGRGIAGNAQRAEDRLFDGRVGNMMIAPDVPEFWLDTPFQGCLIEQFGVAGGFEYFLRLG